MDFRDVAASLHNAVLDRHHLDLVRSRLELEATESAGSAPVISLAFEGITLLAWRGAGGADERGTIAVVGLERLGPAEPWRLLFGLNAGTELELTCARILCDGAEVTGVGRSYRH